MLSRIQDSRRFGLPSVTSLFFIGCLVVSLPTQFYEPLNRWLGGLHPNEHTWLLFTAVFQHGIGSIPPLMHLALMTIVIWLVAPLSERLVGSLAFTVTVLAAIGLTHLLQVVSGITVNGSSAAIWACGPIIWMALRKAKRRGGKMAKRDLIYERSRGMLFLMYILIPLAMIALPYTSGWNGHPLMAFVQGNLYHAAATAVGLAAALVWRNRIAAVVDLAAAVRLEPLVRPARDRFAWIVWLAIDLFLFGVVMRAMSMR